MNKEALKILEIVSNNSKIISTRLSEKYLLTHHKDDYEKWVEKSNQLFPIYKNISDTLVASLESYSPQLCATCSINYRMITRCDRTNKKILSKYCCSKCSSKSKEKSEKFKKSITQDTIQSAKIVRAKTMKEKYGYEYTLQRPEIKDKILKSKLPKQVLDKLNDRMWVESEYVKKARSLSDIALELNIYYGTVGEYIIKHGFDIRASSKDTLPELFIKKILDDNNIKYETNKIGLLSDKKHIDFYISSHNLGIEYNGNWYHQESIRPKGYHTNKSLYCEKMNINLLHFYTKDYIKNKNKMESIIKHHLGLSKKIHARKCDIRVVDDSIAVSFINDNHMQGSIGSSIKIGLYHNNELLSIMTFGKPRYNKKYEYELLRYCTKLGYVVVGGASKLFNHFILQYKPKSILSYCSIDRSNDGDVYKKLGMNMIGRTESYFWAKGDLQLSRYQTQKNKLKKYFGDKYSKENDTEDSQMKHHGWYKVWTAGNYIFEWVC